MSSVLHEVYSYNDYSMSAVIVCLSNCARELKPGGRIIVRDIWSPEPDKPRWRLEMEPEVWDLFLDLHDRSPEPLRCDELDSARRTARFSTAAAVELLSKKDYRQHWELELKERYTSVPLSTFHEVAHTLELNILHAEPSRNNWIVENRWRKDVRGELPGFTNQLVVLEKRR